MENTLLTEIMVLKERIKELEDMLYKSSTIIRNKNLISTKQDLEHLNEIESLINKTFSKNA